MIRSRLEGPPRRRLAVIALPQAQRARLGSIGEAPAAPVAWTTISDEAPESSANWLSYVLQFRRWMASGWIRQDRNRIGNSWREKNNLHFVAFLS